MRERVTDFPFFYLSLLPLSLKKEQLDNQLSKTPTLCFLHYQNILDRSVKIWSSKFENNLGVGGGKSKHLRSWLVGCFSWETSAKILTPKGHCHKMEPTSLSQKMPQRANSTKGS